MTEQEKMLREWCLTLVSVINGFVGASEAVINSEGNAALVKVSYEIMGLIMNNYTMEDRKMLSSKLELLMKFTSESENTQMPQ